MILLVLLITSCGTEVRKNYTINNINLKAEGPLFDGPNTLQASHVFDLTSIDPELKSDRIKSVRLIKASVTTTDSIGFDRIRSLVFQITSANEGLQQLAVLNPVPDGINTADLNPSTEADVKKLFGQNELTFVLDADLEGDQDENMEYSGNFEFEIVYKQ